MNRFGAAALIAIASLSNAFASGPSYTCGATGYQEKSERFVRDQVWVEVGNNIGAYSINNIYKDYVHPEAEYTLKKNRADLRIASDDLEGFNGGAVLTVYDSKNRFVTTSTLLMESLLEEFQIRVQYFDEGVFKTLNVECRKN